MRNLLDPRQTQAVANYTNPKSPTFGNLYQSLVDAGFEESYARSIYSQDPAWLSESMKNDVAIVMQAERNLKRYATLEIELKGKNNIDLAKLQVDVSKFLLKTLARAKYSEDKDTAPPAVQINIINYGDKAKVKEATSTEAKADTPIQEATVKEP